MRWQERRYSLSRVDSACLDVKSRRWHEVIDGVYEVTTDLGVDLWQRCLAELTSSQSMQPNHFYTEPDLGAKDILVHGDACDAVCNYFGSDQWLDIVVDLCNNDVAWVTNWTSPSVEWFRTYTSYQAQWHLAPANYVDHAWHVDCLKTVVHGLMYVTSTHDAKSTTLFRQGVRQHAVTTGFDRGWILLQNGRQEHRGINDTSLPRYVFKWVYTLKI